jgi:hypothetical protein
MAWLARGLFSVLGYAAFLFNFVGYEGVAVPA